MKPTCFSCSSRQLAVDAVEQQPRQRQDRVQRRAELVAHVREEARLHLVRAPQVLGLLVELGVQRDHAAVGVLELAVQPRQLVLPLPQLVERAQQLLVLLLHSSRATSDGACAPARSAMRGDVAAASRVAARARQQLAQHDASCRAPGVDSMSNASISRRAPTMPRPMPVSER